MIRSHFAGGVSEQGNMQKGSSKGWFKESSMPFHFICVAF